MNVVESVMSQSMTPNFLLEYSDIPTTFIKKVGLGLLQRQSIRSASFFVSPPTSTPHKTKPEEKVLFSVKKNSLITKKRVNGIAKQKIKAIINPFSFLNIFIVKNLHLYKDSINNVFYYYLKILFN